MRAEEDRPGIADAPREPFRIPRRDLEMLGRDAVGKRGGFIERAQEHHGSEHAPALARDVASRQDGELPLDRCLDGAGESVAVRHQDRLGGRVVLGLRQEVGSDPFRIVVLVGYDQDFRGARDAVDADRPEHLALGRRDIRVAWPDDLDDGLDRLRAVRKCRYGLRAADAVDLLDAGKTRGRQYERVELAARRRHHHDDAWHARDLGRHRIHEHRARIGRKTARHIEPDGLDGRPAMTEFDAQRIAIALVVGALAFVVVGNTIARHCERIQRFLRRGCDRGIDLGARNSDAELREIDGVELAARAR